MKVTDDNLWLVADCDIRPAGPTDACFYCKAKIGQPHKPKCVIRERTVVVRAIIHLVRRVPEGWSSDKIEYGMNHTRWCANNILDELDSLAEHAGCICAFFEGRYVREATAKDEETFGVEIEQRRKRELDADQD